MSDYNPAEDTSPQVCASCGETFPRNTFRRVIIAGVRRQRCEACAESPRRPPPCRECCDLPHRRAPVCSGCGKPFEEESAAGLDTDRRRPGALALVMGG